MITILVIGLVGLIIAAVGALILFLLSIPFMIIGSILPWFLTILGIVMLVKAVLDKPVRGENFIPGAAVLAAAWLLRLIF